MRPWYQKLGWEDFEVSRKHNGRACVTENGSNPMPDNMDFHSIQEAQKAVAALKLARMMLAHSKHDKAAIEIAFWNFMRLTE